MVEHEKNDEARAAFQQAFDSVGSSRWMGVVFEVMPDGDMRTCRTTCQFPRAKFLVALTELTKQLVEDTENARPTPLPIAPFMLRKKAGDEGVFEAVPRDPFRIHEEENDCEADDA